MHLHTLQGIVLNELSMMNYCKKVVAFLDSITDVYSTVFFLVNYGMLFSESC